MQHECEKLMSEASAASPFLASFLPAVLRDLVLGYLEHAWTRVLVYEFPTPCGDCLVVDTGKRFIWWSSTTGSTTARECDSGWQTEVRNRLHPGRGGDILLETSLWKVQFRMSAEDFVSVWSRDPLEPRIYHSWAYPDGLQPDFLSFDADHHLERRPTAYTLVRARDVDAALAIDDVHPEHRFTKRSFLVPKTFARWGDRVVVVSSGLLVCVTANLLRLGEALHAPDGTPFVCVNVCGERLFAASSQHLYELTL